MYGEGLGWIMVMAFIGVILLTAFLGYSCAVGCAYLLRVPPEPTVETINGNMYVKHPAEYYRVDTSVVYQNESALVPVAASAEKEVE